MCAAALEHLSYAGLDTRKRKYCKPGCSRSIFFSSVVEGVLFCEIGKGGIFLRMLLFFKQFKQ